MKAPDWSCHEPRTCLMQRGAVADASTSLGMKSFID